MTPLVKWLGGKRQLLSILEANIPERYDTYYEPFIGGGALLLSECPESFVMNDSNEELISMYQSVMDAPQVFLKLLDKYQHEYNSSSDKKSMYYKIRDEEFDDPVEKAARFVFLNKTCFNGLYRVNSKGKFNTPWNKIDDVHLYDICNFFDVSQFFRDHCNDILCGSWEKLWDLPQKGDFVYLDPPYDPIKDSGSKCTDYTSDGFTKDDQTKLSEWFKDLTDRGVYVMESNHNTELIRDLYKYFNIQVMKARRNVNCKGSLRGPVEEVLIKNY